MSFAYTLRATLGIALLCIAASSLAVTLGRLQGQATLGKPLDVQIQVMWDGAEDNNNCLAADVSYGDTPVAPAQVTVRMEAGSPTASMPSTVRIIAAALVNEPIVSLNLRSGCRQKSARQYTLFTELPSASASAPASASSTLSPSAATSVLTFAATPAVVAAKVTPTPSSNASPKAQPVAKSPRVDTAPAAPSAAPSVALKVQAPRANTPRNGDTRARLRLDPLELMLELDPTLRISSELLTIPQEEATPERAQAAAWWRALNASPEDALRDAARLQSVQNDIQSLQTIAASNQKSLGQLADKVQRAESEKYANGLVYGLIALCVASLLGVGILWQRLRRVQAPSWSQGLDPGDSMLVYADPEPESPKPKADKPPATPAMPVVEPETFALVDLDLDLMEPPKALHPAPREFSVSVFPSSRSMDSEELLDIRQQAEFFVTLEQHDRAIELLSTRIAQCGESSPLICLDLLKIYHSLGRKADFDILRAEFNHWFTGRVSEFASFQDEGRALSSYPPVMNRIVELWPAPSVLDYIENCIYQHSSTQPGTDFDLQAYRELLLLHSIAKRIMRLAYGNEDEHPSEFMRIPASAASLDAEDPLGANDSRAAAHRAGAHLRGTWNPGIQQEGLDADVDADEQLSTSPLGAMRVPVHALPPVDLELELEPAKSKSNSTDFSFLGLR